MQLCLFSHTKREGILKGNKLNSVYFLRILPNWLKHILRCNFNALMCGKENFRNNCLLS